MHWSPYLAARAVRAFPGTLLLRATKDTDYSIYLDKTCIWADFVAYRGLVWEFGGGVTQNPYRVGYALSRDGLTPITRRTSEAVSDLTAAVHVIDAYYAEFATWVGTTRVKPVDGVPFEIHAIEDAIARRAAGLAFVKASLD